MLASRAREEESRNVCVYACASCTFPVYALTELERNGAIYNARVMMPWHLVTPCLNLRGCCLIVTEVCSGEELPEVEIISLLEEQIPRYRLRADTLTQFQGKRTFLYPFFRCKMQGKCMKGIINVGGPSVVIREFIVT